MLLLLLGLTLRFIRASEVALFASNGCYSHDVMMTQVGEELESDGTANITWIQIYMYDFGFGQMPKPERWRRVIEDRSNEKGTVIDSQESAFTYLLLIQCSITYIVIIVITIGKRDWFYC